MQLRGARALTRSNPPVRPRLPWACLLAIPFAFLLVRTALAQADDGFGEQGANDFRISFVDGTGDPTLSALSPAVAYNSNAREYLVVWSAGTREGCVFPNRDEEVFARRIDASSGQLLGAAMNVSQMGSFPCDNGAQGFEPAVAFNAMTGDYLVAWQGREGVTLEEREIYVRRIAVDGTLASKTQISDMGGTATAFYAFDPAVVWNATENEYLVVWQGTDDVGGLVSGENEIFGQRLDAAGEPIGVNDFRISDMGGTGTIMYGGFTPRVAWNAAQNEYLVVWVGDDNVGGLINNEFEIFGQRLNENGTAQGANDFRISDAGGTGTASVTLYADRPDVVWNAARDEYLVVWYGGDDVGDLSEDELEIFGQRLDGSGGAIGENDFRISDMGGTGDNPFDAFDPRVVASRDIGEYLVVWLGDDDVGGLVDGEREIFGQRLGRSVFLDGFETGDTTGWTRSQP
jgi:roadblock/LC7 domain-containing protein